MELNRIPVGNQTMHQAISAILGSNNVDIHGSMFWNV